jgi:hypothetical protein
LIVFLQLNLMCSDSPACAAIRLVPLLQVSPAHQSHKRARICQNWSGLGSAVECAYSYSGA